MYSPTRAMMKRMPKIKAILARSLPEWGIILPIINDMSHVNTVMKREKQSI